MSMSASAKVFYGLVLGDELEEKMSEWEEAHQDEDDFYEWGEQLEERMGVALIHHGHIDYSHYGLAIVGAWGDREFGGSGCLNASYGEFERIDPLPQVGANWEQRIDEAYFELAELVGIKSRIRPSVGWMLVARYG